jgi:tetratricopeptide (TPR) repeat protein
MPERDDPYVVLMWWFQEVLERDYHAALERLSSTQIEFLEFFPKVLLKGLVYQFMGEAERARISFEAAGLRLEELLDEPEAWPYYRTSLGIAHACLGHKEEAIRQGRLGVERLPDPVSGPIVITDLAHIYVIVGDYDAAMDQIEFLLSIPAGRFMSVPLLRIDPRWGPLSEHPRFQKLLEDDNKKQTLLDSKVPPRNALFESVTGSSSLKVRMKLRFLR